MLLANPKGFERMPRKGCGPHVARWILNSQGKEYDSNDGLNYSPVLPRAMQTLLQRGGLTPKMNSLGNLSGRMKLNLLRLAVDQGKPVALFVMGRSGIIPHWVAVARYLPQWESFLVYDPALEYYAHPDLLVGNRCIRNDELLSLWSLGWWGKLWPNWQNLCITL